jgi:hypothetical protein
MKSERPIDEVPTPEEAEDNLNSTQRLSDVSYDVLQEVAERYTPILIRFPEHKEGKPSKSPTGDPQTDYWPLDVRFVLRAVNANAVRDAYPKLIAPFVFLARTFPPIYNVVAAATRVLSLIFKGFQKPNPLHLLETLTIGQEGKPLE